ncbi:hypothetical protein PR048_010113 [Dryococelus australis]|uniref:Uncharacterized protein n=1 Tax=Dryococelus australis TaxID=614101 RepID=A0ABQ9I2T6_9NEOP|nr:hypothetical protein PR048_010113 [Dryococelus australis]
MGVVEVNMELRRNEGVGETEDPQGNPLTNSIVRHDSQLRKVGAAIFTAARRPDTAAGSCLSPTYTIHRHFDPAAKKILPGHLRYGVAAFRQLAGDKVTMRSWESGAPPTVTLASDAILLASDAILLASVGCS